MVPTTTPLIRFSGKIIWPIGQIQLLVKIRDEEHSTSALMNFVVVKSPYPYNEIIGRPGVRKLQAVSSTAHGMLKLLVEGGVITLKSSRMVPLECAVVSGLEGNLSATKQAVEERIKVEGCSSVRQKKRGQAADRNQAIPEEVGKLVEAGIMKEVHYHDWLSNPVMVKKHDDSWRMCVDFKDLNKACPKDGYLLPEIDWKVESLCGFPFKCFLDAYKGYHQIQMEKEDEGKTTFITSQGIFCYTKMPFRLRNAGATYQRLVDKAFHKQIGRNLEVYIDDLVIKSRTEDEIVRDIEEWFKTLREINMKLNPKKCTFGIEEVMFLGYKVSTRGLKVCPDKVDAVLSLPSPKCLKDVQKLNGKLASLNRLIAELPMLVALMEKEELVVYLAAAKETVSVVLITEKEAKQMPVYFVSRALRGPEVNYTSMEKLVLALVLSKPEVAWRLQKWSIELGEYVTHYRPRVLVKGHILADFIVERPEVDSSDTLMEVEEALHEPWILFDATNNEAEYEALIAGLRIAEQMGVKNLQENVDSRLVANQVNGMYFAKEADMIRYLEKVRALTSSFKAFAIKQVPRSGNTGSSGRRRYIEYLTEETLPPDVKKARAIRQPLQANYVLREIHEGSCSMHAERANRSLGEGIKARLDAKSKNWMDELSHVLWAHCTMIKSSNGYTPFSLTYRTEAVIPAEIGMPTLRTAEVDLGQNNEALEINLDLLEENREQAAIRKAKSKAKMGKYYNSKVRSTSFKSGDLVYRNNDASRTEDTGKLGPKWEGLYEVTEALENGAYKLRDHDGKQSCAVVL
ncbi:reverse transcriptase domain-containing protein [Tanacetum coccineum]